MTTHDNDTDPAVTAAHITLETAEREAEHAAARLADAELAVTAAEAAFDASDADEDWTKVEAARSARERAVQVHKRAARATDAARVALAAAERVVLQARYDDARARAGAAHFRAAVAADLAALAALETRRLAALARVFDATRAQHDAAHAANALADALGPDPRRVGLAPAAPLRPEAVGRLVAHAVRAGRAASPDLAALRALRLDLDALAVGADAAPGAGPERDYFHQLAAATPETP